MTNDRPYHKVMTKEQAAADLKANAGTRFDPELVKIFLSTLRQQETGNR